MIRLTEEEKRTVKILGKRYANKPKGEKKEFTIHFLSFP